MRSEELWKKLLRFAPEYSSTVVALRAIYYIACRRQAATIKQSLSACAKRLHLNSSLLIPNS